MNILLVYSIISVIAFAIGCIVLKIIFGKSFLFRVSILVITAMTIACFLTFYAGVKGIWNLAWAGPVMAAYSIVVFMAINRIRKRLEKLTHQLHELSQGTLQIQLTPSLSEDETGRLNNTIINMLERFKKMHKEIDISAGNLLAASQQTLNASAHLSDCSYTQTFSVENIQTEIEHVQAKIRNQKQISSEANSGILKSLETIESVLQMNLELERKINPINELALGDSVIKPEQVAALVKPVNELISQTIAVIKVSASGIGRMSEMTHEAFCLSEEQSNSMDAISHDMEKLDVMAQQNTLYSVELTACSELLKEEAEKLKSATSVFKAND